MAKKKAQTLHLDSSTEAIEATCETCAAFDSGMCRMNPPVPLHGFPKLLKTEWCLQYISKEANQ